MELGSDHIVPGNGGRHGAAVFDCCQTILRAGGLEMIGMDELGVQTGVSGGNSGKKWMIAGQIDRIPADLRDF